MFAGESSADFQEFDVNINKSDAETNHFNMDSRLTLLLGQKATKRV
jgi:hypothetical protein